MSIEGKINEITGMTAANYCRGVAYVDAEIETLDELRAAGLFDLEHIENEEGPTNGEFYNFLNKYDNKNMFVRLIVIDPKRDDFRIGIKRLYIEASCAVINTAADLELWKDFMSFINRGDVVMKETKEEIILMWH